ncbi:MAG: hypothetical protein U5S82_01540 [Gammaproteobacteria bacterium]|nr:hypothetical protein [Gammaproteobacteria bacterium]
MCRLVIEMPAISDLALQSMIRVVDENDETQRITDEESGPIPLASALSDFFQLTSGIEHSEQEPDQEALSELADYGLDLLDRLSSQLRQLDIHDQADNMACVFVSTAVWFARRGATLRNLDGTADGFARVINGTSESGKLATLAQLIDAVQDATADEIKMDEDKSNPWRPWRVLTLNSGIAATRALDTDLMRATFDRMGRRLPTDLPGFFADGKRQMDAQDVPQPVRDVMTEYAGKWPDKALH